MKKWIRWDKKGRTPNEHITAMATAVQPLWGTIWNILPEDGEAGGIHPLNSIFHCWRAVSGVVKTLALPGWGGLSKLPGGEKPKHREKWEAVSISRTQTWAQGDEPGEQKCLLQKYKHHKISACFAQQCTFPKELIDFPSHWKAKIKCFWTCFSYIPLFLGATLLIWRSDPTRTRYRGPQMPCAFLLCMTMQQVGG